VKWFASFVLTSSLILGSQSADTSLVEKSPTRAFLFSLIPGGGQIYNGKYIKAVLIFTAEAYVVYQFQKNRVAYNKDPSDPARYGYRNKRNKYAWWIGFIYVYSLIDALVDSHLSGFDFDIFEEPESEADTETDAEKRNNKD